MSAYHRLCFTSHRSTPIDFVDGSSFDATTEGYADLSPFDANIKVASSDVCPLPCLGPGRVQPRLRSAVLLVVFCSGPECASALLASREDVYSVWNIVAMWVVLVERVVHAERTICSPWCVRGLCMFVSASVNRREDHP